MEQEVASSVLRQTVREDSSGEAVGETSSREGQAQAEKKDIDFGNPLEEEKTLLSWKSLARPYRKRGRDFYTTVAAVVFLLSIILAFFKEFLLIAVVWALAFFGYVISAVKPEMAEHKLTTRGLKIGRSKYRWSELARFWIEEKWGNKILMLETWRAFPGRLALLLGDLTEDQVKRVLVKRIVYDKPEKTWVDKTGEWLAEKIPMESSVGAPGRN